MQTMSNYCTLYSLSSMFLLQHFIFKIYTETDFGGQLPCFFKLKKRTTTDKQVVRSSSQAAAVTFKRVNFTTNGVESYVSG